MERAFDLKGVREGPYVWAHYNIFSVTGDCMAALREVFPEAQADEMNLCIFSTSGVHGTYNTIEDAERHLQGDTEDTSSDVTFTIIHPRIVCMKYGNCEPQNADDIAFLKKLRETSWKALSEIGRAP